VYRFEVGTMGSEIETPPVLVLVLVDDVDVDVDDEKI
jgi:hypothetical protein